MKERPILFSAPMVRALLNGSKTQTRRVVQWPVLGPSDGWKRRVYGPDNDLDEVAKLSRYGRAGDRLWVRETWYCDHCFERDYELTTNSGRVGPRRDPDKAACEAEWREQMYFRADGEASDQFEQLDHGTGRIWHPSIHMPRWASRITLEVTGVRVEHLQFIRADDVVAEGIPVPPCDFTIFDSPDRLMQERDNYARELFSKLWDSINGTRPGCAWSANPWVWVVSFRRIQP